MRWLRLAAPATLLAAWLAGSYAQQDAPPADTPPARPPAGTPPPAERPPQPAAPEEEDPEPAPRSGNEDDDVSVPTELQPDAAVTFPVDI